MGFRVTSCLWSEVKTLPKFIVSTAPHPHFNLSLEHVLLQSTSASEAPIGFLYRNEPCIVIGRNQNPWRELDVSAMRRLGIKLVRRRSGGGSVYHDLGNTNYSFNVEKEHFTRRFHAELVAKALNGAPIELTAAVASDAGDSKRGAYVNERNDICVALQTAHDHERKVSGSAYKITSKRAYHHGTMLLSSNLRQLGTALRPSRTTMDSKGVASVPSPVVNLSEAFASRRAHLTHDAFCVAVQAEFERQYGQSKSYVDASEHNMRDELLTAKQAQAVYASWKEMDSWDWIWGQTPEFTHRIRQDESVQLVRGEYQPLDSFEIDLHVRHGLIQSAVARSDRADMADADLEGVVERLIGKRYDVLADAPDTFSNEGAEDGEAQSTLSYLGFSVDEQSRRSAVAHQLLPWLKSVL